MRDLLELPFALSNRGGSSAFVTTETTGTTGTHSLPSDVEASFRSLRSDFIMYDLQQGSTAMQTTANSSLAFQTNVPLQPTVPVQTSVQTHPNVDVIRSQNDDEDFVELVELYVSEMPERIAELRELYKSGTIDALKTRAHQIKGSATGYGFPGLTQLAAGLESACKTGQPDQIADRLMDMLSYMSRIRK